MKVLLIYIFHIFSINHYASNNIICFTSVRPTVETLLEQVKADVGKAFAVKKLTGAVWVHRYYPVRTCHFSGSYMLLLQLFFTEVYAEKHEPIPFFSFSFDKVAVLYRRRNSLAHSIRFLRMRSVKCRKFVKICESISFYCFINIMS